MTRVDRPYFIESQPEYSPQIGIALRSVGRDGRANSVDDVVALLVFVRDERGWVLERCVCIEQRGQRVDAMGYPVK